MPGKTKKEKGKKTMAFSFGSLFKSIGHAIASVFSHKDQINAAITDAQTVAGAAGIVLSAIGQNSAAAEVVKVSNGLALVSNAVTSGASADTLTEHVTNLANLTTALVTSGDIGVKNADSQASIVAVANKVQTVVGKVEASLTTTTEPSGD